MTMITLYNHETFYISHELLYDGFIGMNHVAFPQEYTDYPTFEKQTSQYINIPLSHVDIEQVITDITISEVIVQQLNE